MRLTFCVFSLGIVACGSDGAPAVDAHRGTEQSGVDADVHMPAAQSSTQATSSNVAPQSAAPDASEAPPMASNGPQTPADAATLPAPSTSSGTEGGEDPIDASNGPDAAAPLPSNALTSSLPQEETSYHACGCGCCAGALGEIPSACYYPSLGETVDILRQQDEAAAADPNCANVGCSLGTRFVPCETGSVDPEDTLYEVSVYVGALDHLTILRSDAAGRCTRLSLSSPSAVNASPFALDLPESWELSVMDYACADESSAAASSRRAWIGGLGSLSFVQQTECNADLSFTLFFEMSDGSVEGVPFETVLPLADDPGWWCE
jgi:hypothetical protein